MSNYNKNTKIYKNSARNDPEVQQKYTPQYQIMGVDPTELKNNVVTENILSSKEKILPSNPRIRKSSIRQPYAKAIQSPIGRGKGPVPNVGNNMEHTWSSIDGEIIDDISVEIDNQDMIDNNEFVTDAALGINEQNSFIPEKGLHNVIEKENLSDTINSFIIKDDEYILLINGTVFNIGSLDFIQNETKSLIFGDHEICTDSPIPIEDILILKKVKLKIGVFLE